MIENVVMRLKDLLLKEDGVHSTWTVKKSEEFLNEIHKDELDGRKFSIVLNTENKVEDVIIIERKAEDD